MAVASIEPRTVHAVPGTTVVITPPNDKTIDALTIGLLIGSLLLVAATAILAWKTSQLHKATKNLAKDTVEAAKLADRHHQESMSPVCVIEDVSCGEGAAYKSDPGAYGLRFKVHNIGSGPAVLVNVTIIPVGPGLAPVGIQRGALPYSLAAGAHQQHHAGNFLVRTSKPETYTAFLIELQFLSIFNSWGTGRWTVREGEGNYGLVSFDFPRPQERVGVEPPPNPLSSQAFVEALKPKAEEDARD